MEKEGLNKEFDELLGKCGLVDSTGKFMEGIVNDVETRLNGDREIWVSYHLSRLNWDLIRIGDLGLFFDALPLLNKYKEYPKWFFGFFGFYIYQNGDLQIDSKKVLWNKDWFEKVVEDISSLSLFLQESEIEKIKLQMIFNEDVAKNTLSVKIEEASRDFFEAVSEEGDKLTQIGEEILAFLYKCYRILSGV